MLLPPRSKAKASLSRRSFLTRSNSMVGVYPTQSMTASKPLQPQELFDQKSIGFSPNQNQTKQMLTQLQEKSIGTIFPDQSVKTRLHSPLSCCTSLWKCGWELCQEPCSAEPRSFPLWVVIFWWSTEFSRFVFNFSWLKYGNFMV